MNDDDRRIAELEKKLEALQGPCTRTECVRVRSLLKERRPTTTVLESIEPVRVKRMGIVWLIGVTASVFWFMTCIQKGYVTLALVNFIVAFLPLWRSLYVDTPLYMTGVAWLVIVGTTTLMLRGGGD